MARKPTNAENSAGKQRKRPRGKPFEPGNPYAFKPGVCPNPGGRPKSKHLSEAAREWLASPADEDPSVLNAGAVIEAIGQQAKAGDLDAAAWLADRTEGKAPSKLDLTYQNRSDDKLREDAMSSYREILTAVNGDEERAREIMNECAPTLSRYIN